MSSCRVYVVLGLTRASDVPGKHSADWVTAPLPALHFWFSKVDVSLPASLKGAVSVSLACWNFNAFNHRADESC